MVLLAACGPSDEEARKAGFVTGKEMVTATKLGLKNHEEYAAYIEKNEAEKLGFDSVLEMRKLQGQGYQSKALYLEAVAARKGGFTSIEDYRLAQSKAASLIYTTQARWSNYETGRSRMHPSYWELFNLKREM